MFRQKNSLTQTVLLVFVLLLVLAFNQQAFAQAAEEGAEQEELFEMGIEELMEIEVETVTTASKFPQKVTEAPSSITVITADEIRLYGYRTLADILRSVNGFYTSYDRTYEHLGVRGFCLPGDEGSRVLLLLDGNRLNENVRGHGGIGHEFLLDTDLIDRVEIVRGPGSSLYGGNAIFGVINIITKKGKDYDGFEFSGDMAGPDDLATLEAQRGRVTYGKEFKNGMDFLISGTLYGREGRDLFFPHFVEPPDLDGHTKNDDEDSYKLFSKLSLGDLTFEGGYNNWEKLIPTAPLGTVFQSEWENKLENDSGFIAVRYDHEFSDKLAMMLRSSFNFYNYRRTGWYTGADWPQSAVRKRYDRKGSWWNTELQFTAEPWERHKLTWGAEFQYNGRQDQDSSWGGTPYPWGDPPEDITTINNPLRARKTTKNWGVYIQDEFKILQNLTANAGVRYDHYDVGDGSINPRFALIYNHTDATTLKLLYGTAFRPPTLFELYYEDLAFERPSADSRGGLDPETIETYEVVLEHFFDPSLLGTVSLYHYQLHDSIARQSEYSELTWRSMGRVEATGLEAGLQKKWANGITAHTSYSLVDTEYQEPALQSDELLGYTSKRLLNSPKHLFKLNLLAPLVKDKVLAGLEVQYDSRRRTIGGWNDAEEQDRDETDDSFVANLTLTWLDVIKNMDLSFGVYNLFDESHEHPAWGDNELDVINQNGRSFLFNLRYRF